MCVLEALESSSQKKLLSDVRCWEAVTLHDCDNSATAKCCIVVRSTRLWKNEVEQRNIVSRSGRRQQQGTWRIRTFHRPPKSPHHSVSDHRDSRPLHVQKHQRYFSTQPIVAIGLCFIRFHCLFAALVSCLQPELASVQSSCSHLSIAATIFLM